MNANLLTVLKKRQRLYFGLALLTAFMAAMKALGLFSVGIFPWWSEGALSAFMLISGIVLTFKIRNLQGGEGKDDTGV